MRADIKLNRVLSNLGIVVISATAGILLSQAGIFHMRTTKAFSTNEPLLIEGEEPNSRSVLPVGTVLYLDKSWPEGHETFHVYFHFKGRLAADPANSDVIAPLWLRAVDRDEGAKLIAEYPLTKEELMSILKAQRLSKDDIVKILHEIGQ